ncbi:hypothetical protein [Nocardioides sp. SYSU D00038]|uniref:hypothetical protein n=1 Tax=Nocardioides sp. SYSU D00038 TaxID=2812554 RepID=UPI0019687159|nr:hypothetical protein [Nocardioides sp. SYSU D00038]
MARDMGSGSQEHRWVDDACATCGMRRSETWLLDEHQRPVMALVWTTRDGLQGIRTSPWMKGVAPPVGRLPHQTAEQAFPGVEVGREPACRPLLASS